MCDASFGQFAFSMKVKLFRVAYRYIQPLCCCNQLNELTHMLVSF